MVDERGGTVACRRKRHRTESYYYYYCDPRPPKGSVYGQREATGQHGATAPPLTLVPRPGHPPGVAWWLACAEGVLEHSNNKGRKKDVNGGSVESAHVVGAVNKHEVVDDANTQTHSTRRREHSTRESAERHTARAHTDTHGRREGAQGRHTTRPRC